MPRCCKMRHRASPGNWLKRAMCNHRRLFVTYEIKQIRFSGFKLQLPAQATTPAPSNSIEEEIPKMNWVWDDKDEGPVVPEWWLARLRKSDEQPK